jgi:Rrf2 family protein
MRLSARSEYGLLALIDMAGAEDGRPLATRDLAESRGIPPAFLEQLLADLRRAGLVRATRGPRGGFTLTRDPSAITALEIVEALEGPIAPSVCAPDGCGREEGCAAASVWSEVSGAVRGALSEFTLARLAGEQTKLDRAPLTCSTRRSE